MSQPDFRYCPRCRTELAPGRHGGLGAIVERAGRIVLVHSIGRPPQWFGLVAGFLETAETPAECALREVKEELGLDATLGAFVGVYPFERLNQIIFVYHVLLDPGEITLAADELDEYKEIAIERIRPWPQGTGPGLSDWLATRGCHPPTAEFGTPQD
jgi:ADP-ribose pyrophosphatase YjhB (NUDIX family)